jgi:hypothetical protein
VAAIDRQVVASGAVASVAAIDRQVVARLPRAASEEALEGLILRTGALSQRVVH